MILCKFFKSENVKRPIERKKKADKVIITVEKYDMEFRRGKEGVLKEKERERRKKLMGWRYKGWKEKVRENYCRIQREKERDTI